MSQKHEGWTVLPARYYDGGFSGGMMERPALKRLMVGSLSPPDRLLIRLFCGKRPDRLP
jgi:hypothetical protein